MTPQEQAGGLAVTESSAGQQQVAGEQARVLDKAQQVDRMDAGIDAMRPPMRARV